MVGSVAYSRGSMKLPESIASIGIGGGSFGGLASSAAWRSAFHFFMASFAFWTCVSCVRRFALMAAELFFSIRSRARTVTLRPRGFRSPGAAHTPVHKVIGSDHERDARPGRAVPLKLT